MKHNVAGDSFVAHGTGIPSRPLESFINELLDRFPWLTDCTLEASDQSSWRIKGRITSMPPDGVESLKDFMEVDSPTGGNGWLEVSGHRIPLFEIIDRAFFAINRGDGSAELQLVDRYCRTRAKAVRSDTGEDLEIAGHTVPKEVIAAALKLPVSEGQFLDRLGDTISPNDVRA